MMVPKWGTRWDVLMMAVVVVLVGDGIPVREVRGRRMSALGRSDVGTVEGITSSSVSKDASMRLFAVKRLLYGGDGAFPRETKPVHLTHAPIRA